MTEQQYKYVIVGGGLAAGYAAREIAEHGERASAQLCIISADNELPYERPPLSKQFLAGKKSFSAILINEPDFYTRNHIDVLLETVVERVDCDAKLLITDKGAIHYDALLLATGSRARQLSVPGHDLQGIYTLRLVDDARRIRAAAEHSQQAVVIGGSFIGMEVASVLQSAGLRTTMVFPNERVWESFFTPEMSHFFERYYQKKGVTFAKGSKATAFVGKDNQVAQVILDSGRALPADLVVVGVGVEPNVELVRNTPIEVDDGIIVNRFLETIEPNIFVAGDIARYHDPLTGKLRRLEHWDNAKAQGEHAARGLLGIRQEYRHVPYFFSDVFDLSYEFWGATDEASVAIHRGDVEGGAFSTWWLDEKNRLVAAFVLNRPEEEADLAPTWIREGARLDPDLLRSAETLQGVASPAKNISHAA